MVVCSQVVHMLPSFGGVKSLDLTQLESLNEEQLLSFSALTGLESLRLRGYAVAGHDFSFLESMPKLSALDFEHVEETASNLSVLSSLKGLRRLSWKDGGEACNSGLVALRSCTKLQVSLEQSTPRSVTPISTLSRLLENQKRPILGANANEEPLNFR